MTLFSVVPRPVQTNTPDAVWPWPPVQIWSGELPVYGALGSAEIFAESAVSLLESAGLH